MKKKASFFISLLLLSTCAKDSTEDNSSIYFIPQTNTTNSIPTVTQYTITVTAGTGGSVSSAGGTYNDGTSITITATPYEGYEFIEWSDGESSSERTITIDNDISISASFQILSNPFESQSVPDYLSASHFTRIPYLHRNYEDMYNAYGTGLVKDNYVGPPRDAVVIDYNGDGYFDLVHGGTDWEKSFRAEILDDDPLGNQHRNKIQFFKGDERGFLSFDPSMSSKFWGMIHGYKGNVNDYNNDGIPDILFAGTGWHGPSVIQNLPPQYLNHEYPTILLSNGIGNYEQIDLIQLSDHYDHSVSSGDYDNDGDVDIIFVRPGHRPEWVTEHGMSVGRILKNRGDGSFEIIELIETNFVAETQSSEIVNALVPNILFGKFSHELADINNDGYLDLLLGGEKESGSQILLGNGVDFNNGIIDIPGVINYDFAFDFTVNDYDNDGDKDIIVNRIPDKDSGSHYEGWYLQILKNEGGVFIDVTSEVINDNYYFGGTSSIDFMHITDFDNDGEIELFNNEIDRNSDYLPCPSCNEPRLEWEIINGIFIKIE